MYREICSTFDRRHRRWPDRLMTNIYLQKRAEHFNKTSQKYSRRRTPLLSWRMASAMMIMEKMKTSLLMMMLMAIMTGFIKRDVRRRKRKLVVAQPSVFIVVRLFLPNRSTILSTKATYKHESHLSKCFRKLQTTNRRNYPKKKNSLVEKLWAKI